MRLLKQDLPRRIQAARAARGWTQRFLAQKSGLSPKTINEIEGGLVDGVQIATVARIGAALGQPLSTLLAEEQSA